MFANGRINSHLATCFYCPFYGGTDASLSSNGTGSTNRDSAKGGALIHFPRGEFILFPKEHSAPLRQRITNTGRYAASPRHGHR